MAAIKGRKRRRSRPRPVTGQLRSSNARPPPSDSKSYLSASSATPGPSPCSSTYDPHHAQAPRCKLLVMNRSFARRPTPHHVFRHRRLGDLKAKHQQLAMDPRCSPFWVFLAHPSDEIAQLSTNLWPPCPPPRFPTPERRETRTMPAKDGLRLNDLRRTEQARPAPSHPDQQGPVTAAQSKTSAHASGRC